MFRSLQVILSLSISFLAFAAKPDSCATLLLELPFNLDRWQVKKSLLDSPTEIIALQDLQPGDVVLRSRLNNLNFDSDGINFNRRKPGHPYVVVLAKSDVEADGSFTLKVSLLHEDTLGSLEAKWTDFRPDKNFPLDESNVVNVRIEAKRASIEADYFGRAAFNFRQLTLPGHRIEMVPPEQKISAQTLVEVNGKYFVVREDAYEIPCFSECHHMGPLYESVWGLKMWAVRRTSDDTIEVSGDLVAMEVRQDRVPRVIATELPTRNESERVFASEVARLIGEDLAQHRDRDSHFFQPVISAIVPTGRRN